MRPARSPRRRPGGALLVVAAGAALLAAACGQAVSDVPTAASRSAASTTETSATETTTGPVPGPTSTTAAPAPPGTSFAARLAPGIEELMTANVIPGAVVLVRSPEESWTRAFGTRIVAEDVPVTVSDYFRVGSNTKTMVGTVMLQLVEEELISLDDPVSTYRPDVPNGDNITIAQLLDMRSGLASYTKIPAFNQTMDDDPTKAWDPEELLALGLAEPPGFEPPGTGYLYSNTNTVLAGLIIEQLTGQPLEDVLAERIFEPLGLPRTSMPAVTDGSLPDPHPNGYLFGTNVSTIETSELSPEDQAAALAGELLPNDVTDLNPSWGWAAGAAISTADELATYVEALVGGGLLSEEMQQLRLDSIRPTVDGNPSSLGYGLALAKFGPMIGHNGSLPGYQSFMTHDPERDLTLIVFANIQAVPSGAGAADLLAGYVMGELYGG